MFLKTAGSQMLEAKLNEGLSQGRLEGKQEGRQEGRQEALRSSIRRIWTLRFGPPPAALSHGLASTSDVETLAGVLEHVATAEDATAALLALPAPA